MTSSSQRATRLTHVCRKAFRLPGPAAPSLVSLLLTAAAHATTNLQNVPITA